MSPERDPVWTDRALKDAERLDLQTRERVFAAVERLARTNVGDVKQLRGHNRQWRLRVGQWRVLFRYEDADQILLVLRVLHRSRAYRE